MSAMSSETAVSGSALFEKFVRRCVALAAAPAQETARRELLRQTEGHLEAYRREHDPRRLAAAARTVLTLYASLENDITSEQSEALEALLMLDIAP